MADFPLNEVPQNKHKPRDHGQRVDQYSMWEILIRLDKADAVDISEGPVKRRN